MTTTPAPKVGEIWREVDPRFVREVVIINVSFGGVVQIRNAASDRAPLRLAKLSRFNCKRGGYEFVRNGDAT